MLETAADSWTRSVTSHSVAHIVAARSSIPFPSYELPKSVDCIKVVRTNLHRTTVAASIIDQVVGIATGMESSPTVTATADRRHSVSLDYLSSRVRC